MGDDDKKLAKAFLDLSHEERMKRPAWRAIVMKGVLRLLEIENAGKKRSIKRPAPVSAGAGQTNDT